MLQFVLQRTVPNGEYYPFVKLTHPTDTAFGYENTLEGATKFPTAEAAVQKAKARIAHFGTAFTPFVLVPVEVVAPQVGSTTRVI